MLKLPTSLDGWDDTPSGWDQRAEVGPFALLTSTTWRQGGGTEEEFLVCDVVLTSHLRADALAFRATLPDAGCVVDIGSGFGRLSIPLAFDGMHATLLEHSAVSRANAARCAAALGVSERVTIRSDTAASLLADIGPAVFDLAIFGAVGLHILDDDDLGVQLSSVQRLLKPSGRLLLYEALVDGNPGYDLLYRHHGGLKPPTHQTRLRRLSDYRKLLEPAMQVVVGPHQLPFCGEVYSVAWFAKYGTRS